MHSSALKSESVTFTTLYVDADGTSRFTNFLHDRREICIVVF